MTPASPSITRPPSVRPSTPPVPPPPSEPPAPPVAPESPEPPKTVTTSGRHAFIEHTLHPGAGLEVVTNPDDHRLKVWIEKGVKVFYREVRLSDNTNILGYHMNPEDAQRRLRKVYNANLNSVVSLAAKSVVVSNDTPPEETV